MELIFLGTGAGLPSKERNVSSVALSLLQELNEVWLFDCGEATQHQILHTTIKPRKINKIFITHLHGDHIFGLPGFLGSRSFQDGEALTIYGPKGIKKFVETSLEVSATHLTYPLYIEEITEGIIYEGNDFTVTAARLEHGVTSYGYRIEEKDKLGELRVDKLKELGVQPGKIYQDIKNNPETVLPNGDVIQRSDVLGPNKKGHIISILGDTRNTLKHETFIQNSDVLVHEATFDQNKHELAYQYHHSTTAEAAQLALSGQVKQLILTHISARYQEEKDMTLLLQEARDIFPNTMIAEDLSVFPIQKKSS